MSQVFLLSNPEEMKKTLIKLYSERFNRNEKINIFYHYIANAYEIYPDAVRNIVIKFDRWGNFDDLFNLVEGAATSAPPSPSFFEFVIDRIILLFNEEIFKYNENVRQKKNAYFLTNLCLAMPSEKSRLNKKFGVALKIAKSIYRCRSDSLNLKKYKEMLSKLRSAKGTMIQQYLSAENISSLDLDKISDKKIIQNYYLLKNYSNISEALKKRWIKAWKSIKNFRKICYMLQYDSEETNEILTSTWEYETEKEYNGLVSNMNLDFSKLLCVFDLYSPTKKSVIGHFINVILCFHRKNIEINIVTTEGKIKVLNEEITEKKTFREKIMYLVGLLQQTSPKIEYQSLCNNTSKKVLLISSKKLANTHIPSDEFVYWKLLNMKFSAYWTNNFIGSPFHNDEFSSKKMDFKKILNNEKVFEKKTHYIKYSVNVAKGKTFTILNNMKEDIEKNNIVLKKKVEDITLELTKISLEKEEKELQLSLVTKDNEVLKLKNENVIAENNQLKEQIQKNETSLKYLEEKIIIQNTTEYLAKKYDETNNQMINFINKKLKLSESFKKKHAETKVQREKIERKNITLKKMNEKIKQHKLNFNRLKLCFYFIIYTIVMNYFPK